MEGKVLFVDDDPRVTAGLKRALRKEPYEMLSACSADEALDVLARESIDVVVADESMPGMSGSTLLALVQGKYPKVIRMMLTGRATLDTALAAINMGHVCHFFTKPCDEVEIADTIRKALRKKQAAAKTHEQPEQKDPGSGVFLELESKYPGITKVEKDDSGTIVLDEMDTDMESLMEQIKTATK